ncbi:glycosyl transferase (group I), partial [candidate division KSB3 bacterium]|nr:glycosyl transferase (group I) [candidate division KSB3 bacterium]MBD3322954.1 glycosyl transferase (group I) [candidate division KSB3 bacterium]
MNILFLTQRVPYPPIKGDKLRAFHEIKFLSQRHEISLACLSADKKELDYERALREYCQSVDIAVLPPARSKLQSLLSLFAKRPLTLSYFYSRKLQAIVQRCIREKPYDLIVVYCSSMAQYVEHVQEIPKVIDFV